LRMTALLLNPDGLCDGDFYHCSEVVHVRRSLDRVYAYYSHHDVGDRDSRYADIPCDDSDGHRGDGRNHGHSNGSR
ncbi:MAG: hypothetical protein PVJ68_10510, partial [Candidatus Thiodiazotropha sp.]